MPVCSYVIFPETGTKEALTSHLEAWSDCEVQPAENEDVVLLVTDTDGRREQEDLEDRLEAVSSIQMFAQTFGEIVPGEESTRDGEDQPT